ncbi:DUF7344 domain-containing protein [Halopelagius longus]|uniref:DUF7344 domain-containing protein n=1 Tax=Halopelagius longus TaxID=1236180 RepID=A0A1H1BVX6_9EURY|nr:hypothetical protein [Halopelagius longus]RDI70948.1 hypothetical protein DWB78_03955 [Halopelagius longus]SDQ56051.1 hypothetical protein SAMN05216278_1981 [Halopelagius longus]
MSNHIPPLPPDSLAETSHVSRDDLFEALANSRRRTVLSKIADSGTPVELRTLARAVAREEAEPDDEVSEETFESVSLTLYHTHLPKLAHLGLIEFDARRRVVESAIDGIESLPV